MINLDTEQLKSLLAQLESANEQIDEAMSYLQRVTTHSSWGCAERNTINEHILENRQQMQRIQQDSTSFLQTARAVTDDFCTTENDISNWFSSVDEAIARVNSIQVGTVTSTAAVSEWAKRIQTVHPATIRSVQMKLPAITEVKTRPLTVVKLKNTDL